MPPLQREACRVVTVGIKSLYHTAQDKHALLSHLLTAGRLSGFSLVLVWTVPRPLRVCTVLRPLRVCTVLRPLRVCTALRPLRVCTVLRSQGLH